MPRVKRGTKRHAKRKRQLDTDTMVDKADQKRIARMIPYA